MRVRKALKGDVRPAFPLHRISHSKYLFASIQYNIDIGVFLAHVILFPLLPCYLLVIVTPSYFFSLLGKMVTNRTGSIHTSLVFNSAEINMGFEA
jgi:hypothetical protein